ncbi:hypothetical protein SCANM124S_07145 [Streptomyces canus]
MPGPGARGRTGHRVPGPHRPRREKSVVRSPTGKAAVTYRVVSGVVRASGDPIGDPEAWPGWAIGPWLAEARAHGSLPAGLARVRTRDVIRGRRSSHGSPGGSPEPASSLARRRRAVETAHSTSIAAIAARCSLPARFSFTSTSATIDAMTAPAVTRAP